eukprot:TRINITY_DN50216_c0_g1_i1.p1 TRINITY_DN50216_c0_g1~~TRINITY_DN50216_c0_g1_i1.p1  ORF type:complete len:489 (+),score=167.36 TRINITY_DN50216_c0_g1_i1:128-1594(+)
MHDVLACLEAFQARAAAIFDGVEAACSRADERLGRLEGRLQAATGRLEACRGGSQALKVQSARSLNSASTGQPMWLRQRPLAAAVAEQAAASSSASAPSKRRSLAATAVALPEGEGADWQPPKLRAAAEDLARVVHCIAAAPDAAAVAAAAGRDPRAGGAAAAARRRDGDKLLPARGRLDAMSEFFLFNSGELPYKGNVRKRDNLLSLDEDEGLSLAPLKKTALVSTSFESNGGAAPRLDEDEPDPLLLEDDLRFRAKPAAEVALDLPEVLPELGGQVATGLLWREQDQAAKETDRPAWDAPPAPVMSAMPSRSLQSTRSGGAAPSRATQSRASLSAPAPAAPTAPAAPAHAAPVGAAESPAPARPPAAKQAPPPPAGKAAAAEQPAGKGGDKGGKGGKSSAPPPPPPPPANKGKGKAKGPKAPPPPPAAGKGKAKGGAPAAAAAPPKAKAGGGGSMADVFSDIRKGGSGLKKVKTVEKTGAAVGKVV